MLTPPLRHVHRTHYCDHTASLLQLLANTITKILFAWALDNGKLASGLDVRVAFAPIWAVWVVSVGLCTCVCSTACAKRDKVIEVRT